MAAGFQMIHAMLSFEGIPRSWCKSSVGEISADLANWRELVKEITDEDFEENDTLTI